MVSDTARSYGVHPIKVEGSERRKWNQSTFTPVRRVEKRNHAPSHVAFVPIDYDHDVKLISLNNSLNNI